MQHRAGVNVKRIHLHFADIELVGTDLSEEILKLAKDYVRVSRNVKYVRLDMGKEILE